MTEGIKMSDETQTKDRFWLYVSGTIFSLVVVIAMVKQSETEKFAPIKQQLEEEAAQMNIRVLN
jgi:hypothetical protein